MYFRGAGFSSNPRVVCWKVCVWTSVSILCQTLYPPIPGRGWRLFVTRSSAFKGLSLKQGFIFEAGVYLWSRGFARISSFRSRRSLVARAASSVLTPSLSIAAPRRSFTYPFSLYQSITFSTSSGISSKE